MYLGRIEQGRIVMEPLTGVWALESTGEEVASTDLCYITEQALAGDANLQDYLSELWDGESWESITDKLETEGSVWYVWWVDGVRQHLFNIAG